MTPDELAALEREAPVDCPQCGWIHRPSRPCIKTKYRPEIKKSLENGERVGADPFAKFKDWEARAHAHPTIYTQTERTCAGCGTPIFTAENFLGIRWLAVLPRLDGVTGLKTDDPLDEHQMTCKPPVVLALPELRTPRRAGLPYADD